MNKLTILLTLGLASIGFADMSKVTAKSLNNVTVMVSNKTKSSGGSGVILKSSDKGTLVLTNSHVCGVLKKDGGLISTNKGDFLVERYKRSNKHDICLVEIVSDLNKSTKIANNVEFGEKVYVSGHPYLLPNTLTEGYLSNALEITLLIDVKKCTEKEMKNSAFLCFWYNGMPIIKNFTAQTTSAFIAPGNSGSGVFNEKGEIIGLAFAGIGRGISHGLIVPLEYIKLFMNEEEKELKWVEANPEKRYSELGEESENSVTNLTMSTDVMKKLIFPAVIDDSIDFVSQRIQNCLKNSKECSP